jgi:peptide chain release factor 3
VDFGTCPTSEVLERSDGTYLALLVDRWRAQVTTRDNPEVMLDELPAGGN